MRAGEVFREAWRNLLSGTSHLVLWALAFALGVGGLVWLDVASVAGLEADVTAWRSEGGGVMIYTATGAVDGKRCAALADTDGVSASGALRERTEGISAARLPGQRVPWFEVTAGMRDLLQVGGATSTAGAAVMVSSEAARTLGVDTGSLLRIGERAVRVTGTFAIPDDGRVTPLSYSALSEVPASGDFDACWVRVWPPDTSLARIVQATTSLSATGRDVGAQLDRLNPTLAESFDPHAVYAGRMTRWLPWAVVVLGFVSGFASVRVRRLEVASALHAGLPRTSLAAQFGVEVAVWAGVGALIAAPIVVVAARVHAAVPPGALDLRAGCMLLLGVASTFLGGQAALLATRERQLHAIFKLR